MCLGVFFNQGPDCVVQEQGVVMDGRKLVDGNGG